MIVLQIQDRFCPLLLSTLDFVADTTARTMRLLTLLQRRRYWTGSELAERLEVSDRTLRRDVERLRGLGYSVRADRGVAGGYQLEAGSDLTPVLVDNDEAVVLAVGLNLAAQGSPELAEVAVAALSKVLALLPPEQRRRAEAVRAVTSTGPGPGEGGPQLEVLATVAAACRDGVRLSFHYRTADGTESERYVEAYGLVTLRSRFYLVAFDIDRDDWRVFRLDRLTDPRPARAAFDPRPLPSSDLHAHVLGSMRNHDARHRVVMEIDRAAPDVEAEFGRWIDVEELSSNRCRVTMRVDDFEWPIRIATALDAAFTVVEPEALRHEVAAIGERFAIAARGVDTGESTT